MPDGASENLKTRLARARRTEVRTTGMTPVRAWRMSVPRIAENTLGLMVSITGFEESRASLKTAVDEIPDNVLMFLMECPEKGVGLAVLDEQLIAGLIEVQTTGTVTSAPVPERPPSSIDASICSHVIDRWHRGVDAVLGGTQTVVPIVGSRLGPVLEDRRAVALALEDTGFFIQKVTFDLWEGARSGVLWLYYPIDRPDMLHKAGSAQGPQAAVLSARTELKGVLYRTRMALDEAKALQIGDALTFSEARIREVSVQTTSGREVATACLGQAEGHRALKLNDPDAEPEGSTDRPAPDSFAAARPPSAAASGGTDAPAMGDLPELPELPDPMADTAQDQPDGALPDLPDLPDVPAMPDLPDLPDLPEADTDGAAPIGMNGLPELPVIE